MNKKDLPYLVVSIMLFILMNTLIGGNTFPFTEGAELKMDPHVKIAPYMDLESGLYGYIDINGQVLIEPRFRYAEAFNEGVAVIAESDSKGTNYGYIDKKGDIVLPLQYDYARTFHEGLAFVSYKGELIVVNKAGDPAFKLPENMVAGDYASGLAPMYPAAESKKSKCHIWVYRPKWTSGL